MITYDEHCATNGLQVPPELEECLSELRGEITERVYWSGRGREDASSLAIGLELLADAASVAPSNLIPILPIDDGSIACVVAYELHEGVDAGKERKANVVFRWHLGIIPADHQGSLLDVDVELYLRSVEEELESRPKQLRIMNSHMETYHKDYVLKGRAPRGNVYRPLQLACQNVVVGLATLKHDSGFDGLRVCAYLSCDAPHLATNEAERAMIALLLCDAYQNGGTMEIRFGFLKDEKAVPAALKRFARARGFELAKDDSCSISPAEARELFLSVAPIPDALRLRGFELIDRGVISPERFCYVILSNIWRPIELEFLISTSSRVQAILEGGSTINERLARQAESESCRSSLMIGMLFARLKNSSTVSNMSSDVRVIEDETLPVGWSIGENQAFVLFNSIRGVLPWSGNAGRTHSLLEGKHESLIVIPRACPVDSDYELLSELQERFGNILCTLLVPSDMAEIVPIEIPALVCPDRLAELDIAIEQNLARCRIGRS